jgi:putative membrane protein
MSKIRRYAGWLALLCLGLLAPPAALAHASTPTAPSIAWTTWTWNPWVVGSLILAACLYLHGGRALRHTAVRERGVHRGESVAFWSGWCALGVALVSPVHALGAALFSAHMLQHEVLMLVAAPLLVLGRPLPLFLRALPLPWRRQLGKWGKSLRGSWRVLTHPLAAWAVHAAALWVWHIPRLFQATLTSELAHAWQHLSFFGTALCFWWALLYRHQGLQGYGVAVLAVFTTALHSSLLGALLTFAPTPWYPAYAHTTAAWGLTPLEDQQLGGLVMWIPAGVVYLLAALALGAGWLRAIERQGLRQAKGRILKGAWLGVPEHRSSNRSESRYGTTPSPSTPLPPHLPPPGGQGSYLTGVLIALLIGLSSCNREVERAAAAMTGGEPKIGKQVLQQYGCASCHTIPGIPGANALVGPSLEHIASRMYIAGVLPNTPENMLWWLQNPPAVDPLTAMPNLGVTEADARDMAGYLYTLR